MSIVWKSLSRGTFLLAIAAVLAAPKSYSRDQKNEEEELQMKRVFLAQKVIEGALSCDGNQWKRHPKESSPKKNLPASCLVHCKIHFREGLDLKQALNDVQSELINGAKESSANTNFAEATWTYEGLTGSIIQVTDFYQKFMLGAVTLKGILAVAHDGEGRLVYTWENQQTDGSGVLSACKGMKSLLKLNKISNTEFDLEMQTDMYLELPNWPFGGKAVSAAEDSFNAGRDNLLYRILKHL